MVRIIIPAVINIPKVWFIPQNVCPYYRRGKVTNASPSEPHPKVVKINTSTIIRKEHV